MENKTAANAPLPVKPVEASRVGPPAPADFQRFWGDRILRTGVGSFGAAAGATGLYYLARRLSTALHNKEEPDQIEEAADQAEQKAAGLYDDLATGVGRALPDSLAKLLSPLTPNVKKVNTFDPNVLRSSFGTGATLGAGMLGAAGGYKLIKMLNDRQKAQDRKDSVDDAEKEYYAALIGTGNQDDTKSLDNVYAKAAELAKEKNASVGEALRGAWDTAKRIPSAVGGVYVGAGLGLGGIAAKLMYDRARDRSRAKAVEEAAKSRARIAGILPTYVDPDEIAELRRQAAQTQGG